MQKKSIIRSFIFLSLLNYSYTLSALPSYSIIDLGTLGGAESLGLGVNDNGQVSGKADTASGDEHAFRTGNNGIGLTDLGTFGGSFSSGDDINNSGQVTGSAFLTGNTSAEAFRYTATLQSLGTISTNSFGYAINSSGQVTGYSTTNGPGGDRLFLTNAAGTVMTDLGEGRGRGINDNAQLTGTTVNSHAFITGNNGTNLVDIGTLGGTLSSGEDINNQGIVVGTSQTSGGLFHAFMTDNSQNLIDMGTLGGNESSADALNNLGDIVGSSEFSIATGHQRHAFIWNATDGMLDLNSLVIDLGLNWNVLYDAEDISDTGFITGQGVTKNGETHAFLLRLEADTVAEPNILFLFSLVGLMGFSFRRLN